jgi:hypothetical protein
MKRTNDLGHTNELRTAMRKLTPEAYQRIREAHYKAMEGLYALAEATEELAGDDETDPLLIEHAMACAAIEALRNSKLGAVV